MAQGGAERGGWLVIGVSGVTCGGKTTLAARLATALAPVRVLHQDKYFLPDDSPRHVRVEGLEHNNYDILSALDMPAMLRDVRAALAEPGAAPRFLVLEGFTVLNYAPLAELCDLRYYFTLPYGECAARRALRLYDPPDVAGYFERCVWPEHLRYRAQIEQDERVVFLDGAASGALETVLADVRRVLAERGLR